MSWRDVLDNKLGAGSDRDKLCELAYSCGYKFFCHNEMIYFVVSARECHNTGLLADNIFYSNGRGSDG